MKMNILTLLITMSFFSCSEDKVVINNEPEPPVIDTDNEDNEDDDSPTIEAKFDSTLVVKIDHTKHYQEIDCFGASGAWIGEVVGKNWDTDTKTEIAELLFSTEIEENSPKGIGLSHWRVNLGAGSAVEGYDGGIGEVRRTETYLNQDGTYTWEGRCLGQQFFMMKAKEFGCNDFTLFSCSPPVYYTLNGKAYADQGTGKANLKEDCYDDFANYMATVAKHYVDKGYNIKFISPLNEPQSNWDTAAQEGSGWQHSEMAQITRELDKALTEKGLNNTSILLAEPSYWTFFNKNDWSGRGDLMWHLFANESPNYIGNLAHVQNLVCSHSYGIDTNWNEMYQPRIDARLTAEYFGITKLYQSEWCMVPHGKPYEEAPDISAAKEIDLALAMSKVIHQDLVSAQVSGWFYWTALDQQWGNKNQYSLIYVTPQGGDYGDVKNSGTYAANKNLWVLGNYSLFVRPGYKRVELSIDEQNNKFFATAFISPENDKLVVVYTNCTDKTIKVQTDNYNKIISQFTTSDSMNLTKDEEYNNSVIQPRAVATVIYDLN